MDASIVIRTFNEERHLPRLLAALAEQDTGGLAFETLVVDSGSTDRTSGIAAERGCRVLRIPRAEFSFGRSLNLGCSAARGAYLVFVSGHCIPLGRRWLGELVRPLADGTVALAYGRQVGGAGSRFSECRLFEKHFPSHSRIPQDGFFCNNANAALPKRIWEANPFDEELTGLEDMCLAKRLSAQGARIGYVAEAVVEHLHEETWSKIRMRYEREALALQHIMPEIHLELADFLRYVFSSIGHDCRDALREGVLGRHLREIVMYRLMQYWGAYRGNHAHRKVSRERKERYFYPR